MKKILHSLILTLILTSHSYAENIKFSTIETPQNKPQFSGFLPVIHNKGFEKLNQQIEKSLMSNDDTPIEFFSEILDQTSEYLTIHVHLEIRGGRTYYRDRYYVINLNQKKLITLQEFLNKKQISTKEIEYQITQQLSTCLEHHNNKTNLKIESAFCDDPALEYLLNDFQIKHNLLLLIDADNFYLKDDFIGINYDSGAYSYAFEYNIQINQLN